jgi:hypothetical protein
VHKRARAPAEAGRPGGLIAFSYGPIANRHFPVARGLGILHVDVRGPAVARITE